MKSSGTRNRSSSKRFSRLYELLLTRDNAPQVKFQNPDAWRNQTPKDTLDISYLKSYLKDLES
jgi:hypothetical protein